MSDPQKPVVTRFAPSPTGYLHIGGARTALYNWAFARRHGGQFILRLEDTDAARSSVESAKSIIEDLQWLGIHWDQGPDPKAANPITQDIGGNGPYSQSQRLDKYERYITQLLDEGKAEKKDGAIVFKMPRKDITVRDLILGDVTTPADKIIDLVIKKSDGFPTFHFANVIDDATMGVTHVIRAQEHLNNTHKHLALFEALDIAPPQYAHIPLIFNADGSKMSKRDKAKVARAAALDQAKQRGMEVVVAEIADVEVLWVPTLQNEVDKFQAVVGAEAVIEFLQKKNDNPIVIEQIRRAYSVVLPEIDTRDFCYNGYLPEALCNYITLLGWNPGGDVEKFDNAFLASHISLDRVGKSQARFDREKLVSFNSEAIRAMTSENFREKLRAYLTEWRPDFAALMNNDVHFSLFANAYKERTKLLADPAQAGNFFVAEPQFDAKAVEKVLKGGEGYAALEKLLPVLEAITAWSPEPIENAVKQFAETSGLGLGKVAQPLRVAVSGNTVSPPIGATLAILGKDTTLARIRRCLAQRV